MTVAPYSSSTLTRIHFIFTLSMCASKGTHRIGKFQVLGDSACSGHSRVCNRRKGPTENDDPGSRQPWGNPEVPGTLHLHLAEWSSLVMAVRATERLCRQRDGEVHPWGDPVTHGRVKGKDHWNPAGNLRDLGHPRPAGRSPAQEEEEKKTLQVYGQIYSRQSSFRGCMSRSGPNTVLLRGRTLDRRTFGSHHHAPIFYTPGQAESSYQSPASKNRIQDTGSSNLVTARRRASFL